MREEFYEEWEPGEREQMNEKARTDEGEHSPLYDHTNDYPPTINHAGPADEQSPDQQNPNESDSDMQNPDGYGSENQNGYNTGNQNGYDTGNQGPQYGNPDPQWRYGNPYGHPQPQQTPPDPRDPQANDPLTRYRNGNYQGGDYRRPNRNLPELTPLVRAAFTMGLFSMTLAMLGCCMNVYILFGAAIASIAGMVTAILSKTERRMHPSAAAGMILSVIAILITLFTVCSYSFMIRHPELIDEAMKVYESLGILPPGQ